jgi:hypothetical protein
VLHPHLATVVLLEGANPARVPQLRRDAQVLAAPHQRVGLAALAGGGDRLGAEVLALAARVRHEAVSCISVSQVAVKDVAFQKV